MMQAVRRWRCRAADNPVIVEAGELVNFSMSVLFQISLGQDPVGWPKGLAGEIRCEAQRNEVLVPEP
jgi:hypothetical protein